MANVLEKYISDFEKKKIEDINFEFINIFSEIIRNIKDYEIDDFILIEKVITYFKIFRRLKKDLDLCEENELLNIILESSVYRRYLSYSFKLHYPKNIDSLYRLELQFVSYLKNMSETIEFDEYGEILYTLYYLSDFINDKTIYIAHNILLFYNDVISNKEFEVYEKKDEINNLYMYLTEKNSNYQKYKR